ncbi:heme oxygenase [Flavobacterium cyanobacteriorum]|uniref:Heme oxygenase n=1 Tax=Flavobacterium cyanobacteriorum TaxID=2022802 RepID=A0A255ZY44_9FLAO|nr:DUF3050 domain-containing protein [Flavobacterium cyanobacteriorum]OYQ46366.1 heme oxygenase [Flavobacterium cyanobacteriorum]
MNIDIINSSIRPQKELLLQHPLYNKVKTIDDLRHFLEGHVYAVWDFMSLLKALQAKLTCTSTPWLPVGNPELRYLINEIVLAEETDVNAEGKRQSHYEMYVDAMKACAANTAGIEDFLTDVVETQNIFVSIKKSSLHPDIKAFLDFTFRVIDRGRPHEIAAAFTFGREDLIPSMFTEILRKFQQNFPETNLRKLIYYFERHIALDADEHGPMAMQMINELCGNDAEKWREAAEVAMMALEKRIGLWNAIEENIMKHDMAPI